MVVFSSVWLCLYVCWAVLAVSFSEEDIKEGAPCKRVNGTDGICKVLWDCSGAIREMKTTRKSPQFCCCKGEKPLVCCEPDRKSVLKCKEYAESVFLRVPDLMGDGFITYDTCNTVSRKPTRFKRLANGMDSDSREFPHMALIGYIDVGGNEDWGCSGSLISDRFVLTVAQCAASALIRGPPRKVRLGDHRVRTNEDEDKGISQPSDYEIIETFIHPDYDIKGTQYNDIALLKLNTTVCFTEFIRPICLHTEHELPSTHALVSSWGGHTIFDMGDTLQTLNLSIISNEHCNEFYKNVKRTEEYLPNGIVDATMVCAGDIEHHNNTFNGDGGIPLQVPLEDPYCMYTQVGITSLGVRRRGYNKPVIYTRVSYYLTWIESIVWP